MESQSKHTVSNHCDFSKSESHLQSHLTSRVLKEKKIKHVGEKKILKYEKVPVSRDLQAAGQQQDLFITFIYFIYKY